jgi:hypothetical protein
MDGKSIIARFEQAKNGRYNFDNHWQEVADLVLPTREFQTEYAPGEKRRNKIFSDVAPEAAESLAAALSGLLTNTSTRWFSLMPTDPNLRGIRAVDQYLYDVTEVMLSYFDGNNCGFALASHEMYLDIVCFGTGCMLVNDTDSGPSFQARDLSNFYLMEDDQGKIVEVYRKFKMTEREAYETFGDQLSEKTLNRIREGSAAGDYGSRKIEFIHAIIKRYDRDMLKLDNTNMEYASFYIERNEAHICSEGGYKQMPYLFPRWSKSPEETYGRSPAMKVLPGIKVANVMARNILEASELAIRPPIMMPANSIEGPLRTSPGSLIYYRQGSRDYPRPLVSGANPGVGENLLQRQESRIEKAFFLENLKMPNNDRMTATEIIQRRQEGLMQAAPILSRLYAEFLDPLISRTFISLNKAKLLPEPPSVLEGRALSVEYRSPMANSKRQSHTQSFMQAMQAASVLFQIDPMAAKTIDVDAAIRDIFESSSVDPKYLKDAREVEAEKQQMQAMQQQAMQAELAQKQGEAQQAQGAPQQ